MMLPSSAIAAIVAWNALVAGPDSLRSTPITADSIPVRSAVVSGAQPLGVTLSRRALVLPRAIDDDRVRHMLSALDTPADTVRRVRAKAVVYSDAYQTRLMVHRTLSWTMIPLFAVSYFSGDQLFKSGSSAPAWARKTHAPAATGAAILFTAQSITGYWNLWESRHIAQGRTRRIVHSVLFTTASAGFAYAGSKLANDAEQSQVKRQEHRNIALGSMGVSTMSWLLMLIGN